MHELAIAEGVVGIATDQAAGRRVARVEVRVGHLRQVVPSALSLGFELAAQGTCAEGAELTIEEVPARGACRACGAEGELGGLPLACGACGGLEIEVTAGEELLVDAIEVIGEPARAEGEVMAHGGQR